MGIVAAAVRLIVFLLAASLYNLGVSVFFLLYNLHLLDLGYQESFLGLMTGIQTAGSICGTLPAGWFGSRFGLRAALGVTFLGGALVSVARAAATGQTVLLVLAFLGGIALAGWAVSVAPTISQLVPEAARPRAFSVLMALGIGMGALAGLAGGRLPQWTSRLLAGLGDPKQLALWAGAAVVASALLPLAALRLERAPATPPQRPPVPSLDPFLRRYLLAALPWNLFVGAFPSFFNVYFSRLYGAETSQVGLVFAGAQAAQVAAVLLAPWLFARLGLARGIPVTQVGAAAMLVALAAAPGTGAGMLPAAVAYAGYLSCQWMSDPGWLSLLMNRTAPERRSGGSAWNFFVVFSTHAVAATAFGAAVTRLGYARPLLAVSLLGLLSAGVFRKSLGETASEIAAETSAR